VATSLAKVRISPTHNSRIAYSHGGRESFQPTIADHLLDRQQSLLGGALGHKMASSAAT
jgi:hypothetical protein